MARSTTRARVGKTAPQGERTARAAQPGKGGGAREAISGFIRTLEKLDAAATRAAGPTQNKAALGAPEGKSFRAPEGK